MPRDKVTYANSLEAEFPDVAKQWDYEKNSPLNPADVNSGSHKEVWWKCDKGPDHEWSTNVKNRTLHGSRCPFCTNKRASVTNSLARLFPEVAVQWDQDKNERLTPADVVAGSNKRFWWRCDKGPDHSWPATVQSRTYQGTGCSCCAGLRPSVTNSLAGLFPGLAAQWDYDKNNGLTPAHVVAGSNKRRWWRCDKGPDHNWPATVVSRTRGENGCPCCDNKRVSVTNSLAALFPEVAAQWDYERNGETKPEDVVAGTSTKKFWWVCHEGPDHNWPATPQSRTRQGSGCPACDGKQVSVTNSLAALFSELVDEWHTSKNGRLQPKDVVAGSEKRVWWKCRRNPLHVWMTSVAHRTQRGQGCRRCNRIQSEPEIVLACELEQFFGGIDHNDRRIVDPDGRSWEVDIKIPTETLVIEYDGCYFHEGEENRDRTKAVAISRAGWRVVRVREEGLDLVQRHDILVEQPYANDVRTKKRKLKMMVDTVLRHLQDNVVKRSIPGINDYLMDRDLTNYGKACAILSSMTESANAASDSISRRQLPLFC